MSKQTKETDLDIIYMEYVTKSHPHVECRWLIALVRDSEL